MPRDAGDGVAVPDQSVDRKALAHVDAALRGRVDEQLVEHGSARTEAAAPAVRVGDAAAQREGPEVEDHVERDRRAVRGREPVEESPAVEALGAVRPDDVRRDGVARERGPVDEQDAVALAGEEHGRGGSGAARADDDRVIHMRPLLAASWEPLV